jgi:hypothetical protein
MQKVFFYIIFFFLISCATITAPSSYPVSIKASEDKNIKAQYNEIEYSLPAIIYVQLNNPVITFTKNCYISQEVKLKKELRVVPVIFGNIIWLVLPGFVVDVATGEAWQVEQIVTSPSTFSKSSINCK